MEPGDSPANGRARVLMILSGGGFAFETKCLLASLGEQLEFGYILTEYGGTPGEAGIPPGRSWLVPTFSTVTKWSLRRSLNAFWQTFLITRRALREQNVEAVIAIGCSHAVPMFLAARLARKPTVFLESITRTDRLSNTGKLVYRLRLASLFLVQWPRLQAGYPSIQVGTVM